MPPAPQTPRTLRAATADSLAVDAATIEAFEALGRGEVRPLLLKGPAVARLLYDGGEERSWDDADLLVDPSRHAHAMEILAGIGFRPRFSDPVGQGSVPHAVQLVRPGGAGLAAVSIDLHVGFAGVEAPAAVFWESLSAGRETIELFGRPVDVPSTPARLALVSLHAASHGGAAHRSLGDLQRAVARFGHAAWSEAAALAEAWSAVDYFVVGLRLDSAGGRLLEELGIDHRPSTAAVMRGHGMPRAQRSFEQLQRTEGWSARAEVVTRKLIPAPEVMRSWQPLARRGPAGLALAYAWRPLWLLWQIAPAVRSYSRARRG